MRLFILLFCLLFLTPVAHAKIVGTTIIEDKDADAVGVDNNSLNVNLPSNVSGDTVGLTTTAAQLPTLSIYAVTIVAPSGNAGVVYIGDSTLTTASGMLIGTTPVRIKTDNLSDIYVVSTVAADKLHYIAERR